MKEIINTDDLFSKEDKFLKLRQNSLLLSDYQIEILKRNNINYSEFSSYKDLLFIIEEILNDNPDNEELEHLSDEINSLYYYNYSDK